FLGPLVSRPHPFPAPYISTLCIMGSVVSHLFTCGILPATVCVLHFLQGFDYERRAISRMRDWDCGTGRGGSQAKVGKLAWAWSSCEAPMRRARRPPGETR